MRIVTWNINGIRTFKGGIKKALDSLDADIVCVQETKVTRDLLDERTAIVEGYNSYFSFSRGRSGYSGVATYCKDCASPFSAEERLTGLLNTSLDATVGSYGNQTEFSSEELQLLDNEGRAVITQHKVMFENQPQTLTVVNVYCPRADPDKPDRKLFKLRFYRLLQLRAEAILKDGSHVIVLGDVNTAHRPVDHCDPDDINDFEGNPGRKWLNGFLLSDGEEEDVDGDQSSDESCENKTGKFVDTFRHFHPQRTNAFTCWSTLTGARQTNYGTRIDYIFADSLLVKRQFVAADIMPEVEGSDHCPVWAQLSCSPLPSSKLPPLCTQHLPEFAGKQQKLSRFLVKVEKQVAEEASGDRAPLPGSQEAGETRENRLPYGSDPSSGMKRTLTDQSVFPKAKKPKTVKASSKAPSKPQGSLLAFFKPRSTLVVPPMQAPEGQQIKNSEAREGAVPGPDGPSVDSMDLEGDQSVCLGGRAPPPCSPPQDSVDGQEQGPVKGPTHSAVEPSAWKGAPLGFWKTVLHGPPQPPPCKTHREPCVLRTVRKAGPNMGRQFFVCARPQGHTSNPEARCNFFAWVDKGK